MRHIHLPLHTAASQYPVRPRQYLFWLCFFRVSPAGHPFGCRSSPAEQVPEKNKKSHISLGTKYDSVLPPKFTALLLPSLTSTFILSFCNGKAPSAANNFCSRPPSATHSLTSDPVHHTIAQSLNIRASKLLPCLTGLIQLSQIIVSRILFVNTLSIRNTYTFRAVPLAIPEKNLSIIYSYI